MPRFRCNNCGVQPRGLVFEANDPVAQCPKCGRAGPQQRVYAMVDVHFVVMDAKGAIFSDLGRQYIACQPKREHMALPFEQFAATDHPAAVTCPACMRTKQFQDLARLFPGVLDGEAVRGGITIDGAGCCG